MTPPIKKTCPECGGTGKGERNPVITWEERTPLCKKCLGKKEVYNYLTPEQYVQWMRIEGGAPEYEMLDMCAVWHTWDDETINEGWTLELWHDVKSATECNVLVVMDGQPKPDDSWMPASRK